MIPWAGAAESRVLEFPPGEATFFSPSVFTPSPSRAAAPPTTSLEVPVHD